MATDLGAVSLGDHQFDTVNFNPLDAQKASAPVTIAVSGFDASLLTVVVAPLSPPDPAFPNKQVATMSTLGKIGGPTTVQFDVTSANGTPTSDSPITVEITVTAEQANAANASLGTPAEEP